MGNAYNILASGGNNINHVFPLDGANSDSRTKAELEGRKSAARIIETACFNLGELGYFGNQLPADINNLTERVERIAQQVILRYDLTVELFNDNTENFTTMQEHSLFAKPDFMSIYNYMNGPLFRFDFFNALVDYDGDPAIKDNIPRTIKIVIENHYKVQENVNVRWLTPENWDIYPSRDGKLFVPTSYFGSNKRERIQSYAML